MSGVSMPEKNVWLNRTKADLSDYSTVVLFGACDGFIKEDFLEDHQQLNLDRAFEYFFESVRIVFPGERNRERRTRMLTRLAESYEAFKNGDEFLGARKIREFRVEAGFSTSAD